MSVITFDPGSAIFCTTRDVGLHFDALSRRADILRAGCNTRKLDALQVLTLQTDSAEPPVEGEVGYKAPTGHSESMAPLFCWSMPGCYSISWLPAIALA